jgi:CheY-like chemotaxis protein
MNGYRATRRIKGDPALRSILIIAVTSYALSGEEKNARAAGCGEHDKVAASTGVTVIGQNRIVLSTGAVNEWLRLGE